jgi:hypothetical protein
LSSETEREADLQAQMVAYQDGRVEAFDALTLPKAEARRSGDVADPQDRRRCADCQR